MNPEEKIIDIMKDFENAMLVTQTQGGELDARPMEIAEVSDDGQLWFITDRNSGKMAELNVSPNVAVTMQGKNKFAAVRGHARAVEDRDKIESLWHERWKVWFPKGKQDPSIILLVVQPDQGEYWDNSGVEGLKYMIKSGKAYLQGERASTDASINASVSMPTDR